MNRKNWKKEQKLFLSSALQRYRDIGMLWPSSHRTAKKATSLMPIEHISRVLEVGSGTGRLTRAIHKRLPREATLFCVERNPKFCAYLKEIFPNSNVVVINERFENLLSFHSEIGVALVDCIILSLPMALVPDVLRQLWLDIAHTILKKDGYLFIHQFIPVIKQYLENPRWVMESRKWIVGLPPYCFEVYRKRVDS